MAVQSGQKDFNLINDGNTGRLAADNGGSLIGGVLFAGGTFTANGTTPVAVANTNVTANSIIVYTLKNVNGGTPAGKPYETSITPGTGFDVAAAAGDTGIYNYSILG
jgi:hypothetical protein